MSDINNYLKFEIEINGAPYCIDAQKMIEGKLLSNVNKDILLNYFVLQNLRNECRESLNSYTKAYDDFRFKQITKLKLKKNININSNQLLEYEIRLSDITEYDKLKRKMEESVFRLNRIQSAFEFLNIFSTKCALAQKAEIYGVFDEN